MATPSVRLEKRLGTSGGGYWSSSTWTNSDFQRVEGAEDDLDYDLTIVVFQILKQDFTGTDPLSVTMNDSDYVEFSSGGPTNVAGWTSAPSYVAQRAFYAFHERGQAQSELSGSHTGGFIMGQMILLKNVVQQAPTDVSTTLAAASYNGPVSVTSSVGGIALHASGTDPGLRGSGLVATGDTFTSTQINGIRDFYLLATFAGLAKGWVVGSVGW